MRIQIAFTRRNQIAPIHQRSMTIGCMLLVLCLIGLCNPADTVAGWPWVDIGGTGAPRIDVMGPLGNRLPVSYRRKYNRPTYVGGKMAAMIEPSSQEALAWHRANTLGLYDNNGIKGAAACKHCPPERVEQHYFYPKPWEVLTVGPRRSLTMTTPQYGVVEDESLPSPSDKHDEEPAAEEQDTNPSEEKHDLELDDDEPEVIPPAPTRSKELVGEFERLLNSPL